MARTLGSPINKGMEPGDFDKETRRKLLALDEFRNGNVYDGLLNMGYETEEVDKINDVVQNIDVTPYAGSPTRFKEDMLALAGALEKEGY